MVSSLATVEVVPTTLRAASTRRADAARGEHTTIGAPTTLHARRRARAPHAQRRFAGNEIRVWYSRRPGDHVRARHTARVCHHRSDTFSWRRAERAARV
jgi:hypothetical protein